VPKCPGDDLEDYPYIIRTKSSFDGLDWLTYTDKPLIHNYFVNGSNTEDVYSASEPTAYISYTLKYGTEWENSGSGTYVPGNTIRNNILWANYTILKTDTGEVWVAGSAVVPETTQAVVEIPLEREPLYVISGSTLNAIGTVVQKITGCAAQTPSGMASTLQAHFNTEELPE
jgi:hypothetical protein